MASLIFLIAIVAAGMMMFGGLCFMVVVDQLKRNCATDDLCQNWRVAAGSLAWPGLALLIVVMGLASALGTNPGTALSGALLGVVVGGVVFYFTTCYVIGVWRNRLFDLREETGLTPVGEQLCQEHWHGKVQYMAAFFDGVWPSDDQHKLAPLIMAKCKVPEPPKPEPGNDELRSHLIDHVLAREGMLLSRVQLAADEEREEEHNHVRAHTQQRILEIERMNKQQLRQELGL